MPPKPRVKAPQKRSATTSHAPNRGWAALVAVGATALVAAVAGLFFLLGTGDSKSPDKARAALTEAGCSVEVKAAVPNVADHSDFQDPGGTSPAWNTDPPTTGPHFGVTLIYGSYTEPVEIGRLVHNLEHGAVYILYGSDVPETSVAQLASFYAQHENGTVLAPYPKLRDKIALGSWFAAGLSEAASARGSGVLAKCSRFDEKAFEAFFDAFQFQGPESGLLRPSDMKPGEQ